MACQRYGLGWLLGSHVADLQKWHASEVFRIGDHCLILPTAPERHVSWPRNTFLLMLFVISVVWGWYNVHFLLPGRFVLSMHFAALCWLHSVCCPGPPRTLCHLFSVASKGGKLGNTEIVDCASPDFCGTAHFNTKAPLEWVRVILPHLEWLSTELAAGWKRWSVDLDWLARRANFTQMV